MRIDRTDIIHRIGAPGRDGSTVGAGAFDAAANERFAATPSVLSVHSRATNYRKASFCTKVCRAV